MKPGDQLTTTFPVRLSDTGWSNLLSVLPPCLCPAPGALLASVGGTGALVWLLPRVALVLEMVGLIVRKQTIN